MTEGQFWDSDSTLAIAYRKAEEIRRERKNEELWLQGMYIYEALGDTAPILHAFAKKGTKPLPYSEEPYSISKKQLKAKEEEKERKVAEKGRRLMERLMAATNNKFAKEKR